MMCIATIKIMVRKSTQGFTIKFVISSDKPLTIKHFQSHTLAKTLSNIRRSVSFLISSGSLLKANVEIFQTFT